ncbi:MAG TPA: hypothetical protein PLZ58_04105 [Candidatus Saccharibacteria bacterium]|nr:hypothetical protein [Candidatus Saccharibacteria bacterium]
MANLGTLTLDLVAKTGNFIQGMDKSERSVKKFVDSTTKGAKIAAGAITAMAAASAAAAVAMVNNYRDVIDANAKTARALETTYSAYVSLKEAAGDAGVGMSTVESASRTLNRELGKALSGSQKQIEAFKRLKLSAEEVAKLPLDERIAKINQALVDNVDVNQRAAAAAELFGSKNGAAMQLLNAEGIESAAERLDLFGLRLSEVDAAKVETANDAIARFGLLADGVGTQLAVELAPVLQAIADLFMDSAREAGGMGNAVQEAVQTGVKALAFMADAADGVKRVFQLAADGIILILNDIAATAALAAYRAVEILNAIPGVDFSDELKAIGDFGRQANSVVKLAAENMQATLDEPLAGAKLLEFYEKAQIAGQEAAEAAVAAAEANRKSGEVFTKASSAGTKAIKNQRDAIGDLIKSLELEYATVGMSRKEQVLYKAALDGAKASQLAQVSALLSTIDAHEEADKAAKAYADTVRSLRTDEEKRTDTLRDQLEIIRAAANVSQEDKDKAESRAVQGALGSDKPDFAGGDSALGELYRFDKQQKEIESWYTKQLDMLDTFRSEFSDKEGEWNAAELELKQQHADQLAEIDLARKDVLLATSESMFASAADLARQFAGESSGIYKALFIAEKAAGIARAGVAIQTGIALAAANPWPLNLGAIATVIAATAGMVSNIGAIGMAHDGIDSVPKTGTWLLEKGERVITSKTSAKLDGMIEGAARGGMGGRGNSVNQTINVTGTVDSYTASQLARQAAQRQAIAEARLG